jgi:hypothetical protein
MRTFFDRSYPNAETAPLLGFYEAYYRERRKREEAVMSNYKNQKEGKPLVHVEHPAQGPSTDARLKATRSLVELIRTLRRSNDRQDEVNVTREHVDTALSPAGYAPDHASSLSVFCHLLPPSESTAGVWRIVSTGAKALPGYGKFFSRFLYMLPETVLDNIRDVNRAGRHGEIFAEIGGDGDFNANLHPSMLPWEIENPFRPASTASENRLKYAELIVRRDPADPHALQIINEADDRVWPIDLGFLTLLRRPALYNLVTRFQPVGHCVIPLTHLTAEEIDEYVSKTNVTYLPRVVFEERVVIARRRWVVPESAYPRQRVDESDAGFFLRVHEWRSEHGIPGRVFVRYRGQGSNPPKQNAAGDAGPDPDENGADPGNPEMDPAEFEQMVEPSFENLEVAGAEQGASPQTTPADIKPNHAEPTAANPAARPRIARPRGDENMPQYIDFDDPLSVKLFNRIAANRSKYVVTIDESLPDIADGMLHQGDSFHFECILQFNPQL